MSAGGFAGALPGFSTAFTSVEADIIWGNYPWAGCLFDSTAQIDSVAVDSTNTPTSLLRPGLVLGQLDTNGHYVGYSPSATDGSQQARAVLLLEVNMLDPFTAAAAARYPAGILLSGPVKGKNLTGLDQKARAQLKAQGFLFDDDLYGNLGFPWRKCAVKTAAYQVLAADQNAILVANGAGSTTFTLPAIAVGMRFRFLNLVGQNMVITSTEGTNVLTVNNASATTLTFSTANMLIGAYVEYVAEYIGATLKWVPQLLSSGVTTVTVT